jgi:hypothetical protein
MENGPDPRIVDFFKAFREPPVKKFGTSLVRGKFSLLKAGTGLGPDPGFPENVLIL